jgi:hypothetical protein
MARKVGQIIARGDHGWLMVGGAEEFRKYSGTGFTRVVLGTRLVFTDGATWRLWVQPELRAYRRQRNLFSVSGWPTIRQRQEHSWFSMEHPNSNVGPSCQISPKR